MKSFVLYIALVAFAGSVVGRSPPVAVIPENCVFLTNTQTATGGQYSYIDPLGSLITITYELGTNGQYTENRKVVLDYASGHSGSGAQLNNINVVIGQVIREIEIKISTTIQEVLKTTNVNGPNFRPRNLVTVIVQKLRSIIATTVRRIISESGLKLNIKEVTQNVITQIQPSILEGVNYAIQGSSTITIGVNKPGAKPTGAISGQGESSALLIDQLIAQLRPIIAQLVNKQTKIHCNNHSKGSSTSTSSSGFTSTITSTGVRPSTSYGTSRPSRPISTRPSRPAPTRPSRPVPTRPSRPVPTRPSRPITTRPFKPVPTRPIRPITTRPFKPVPTRPVRPVTPVRPIKPVVTVDINTLTNELVEIIVKSLKNDIQTAVLIEIRAHSENDDEVLADAILNTLRSSIIQVITTTVNSNSKFSGFKSDIQSLTTRILKKLRPIILGSIKAGLQKVRQEQAKQAQLAQGQLIDSVIAQISGLIQSEVRAVIQGYSGSLANASQESLIDAIIQRLRPIILSTLKKLQRSDSRFSSISSSSFNSLVDQIVAGLRPLIIQYIEEAFNSAVLEGQLIELVITQIKVQVQQQVNLEIQGTSGSLNKQRLVTAVINRLRPIILSTLKNLQRSDSRFAYITQFDSIVNKIIDGLRSFILQYIDIALQTAAAEGEIISVAVSQVRGLIEAEVNAEIQGYSGSLSNVNKQSLLKAIIQRLRPIIFSTLEGLKRSDSRFSSISSSQFNGFVDQVIDRLTSYIIELIDSALQNFRLQASLIEEFITIVIGQLDGDVQSFVLAELKGLRNLDNVNEQRILQAVISKMTPIIRQTIQSLFRSQSRFAVLSSQIDLIIQRIIDALRPILLDAIRFNIGVLRRESIKVVTQPPPKKQQITNLFGISGENNVKVETPKFNYQYAIDFSKRR